LEQFLLEEAVLEPYERARAQAREHAARVAQARAEGERALRETGH
jgi:hypothetical protein